MKCLILTSTQESHIFLLKKFPKLYIELSAIQVKYDFFARENLILLSEAFQTKKRGNFELACSFWRENLNTLELLCVELGPLYFGIFNCYGRT